MLVLSRNDVEALLDLDALVDALADAFVDLSGGRASMPQRVAAFSGHGLLGVMPAYLPSANLLETKLVTLFEGNAGTELPTHQAAIAVFDPERGALTALMDGTYITATRTAAGSALSARVLAREDAKRARGVRHRRAGAHARAGGLASARDRGDPHRRPRSREGGGARGGGRRRARSTRSRRPSAAPTSCARRRTRPQPVVRSEWVAPGTHVTSVGVNPAGAELEEALVADAHVFVESREARALAVPGGRERPARARRPTGSPSSARC